MNVVKLVALIAEVKSLMAESAGVAGYHLNGDIATWDEILSGPLSTLGEILETEILPCTVCKCQTDRVFGQKTDSGAWAICAPCEAKRDAELYAEGYREDESGLYEVNGTEYDVTVYWRDDRLTIEFDGTSIEVTCGDEDYIRQIVDECVTEYHEDNYRDEVDDDEE